MEENKAVVNILWTGGWDSTFRIINLSFKDITIQPYYLKDNRMSEQYELNSIKSITRDIKSLKTTKCEIKEVQTLRVDDVEKNNDITNSYKYLRKKIYFGSQYDWLARFANINKELELTIHRDDKAYSVIEKYGKVKEFNDEEVGKYFKIDFSSSSKEVNLIFGNFRFPLLDYTKIDMKKEAEEKGYIDLMNKTWFCFTPINGQPCGTCNPCQYTVEEGLKYRFSRPAIRRYKIRKLKKTKLIRAMSKLKTFIKKLFNRLS